MTGPISQSFPPLLPPSLPPSLPPFLQGDASLSLSVPFTTGRRCGMITIWRKALLLCCVLEMR